jgi:hypothetical protein
LNGHSQSKDEKFKITGFLFNKTQNPINMKYFNIPAILIISSALSFYGCNENTKNPKTEAADTLTEVADTLNATNTAAQPNLATPTTPAEPPQNADGVWHYTCAKGCAGGAGAAGACATCGGALAHNQAYHGNDYTHYSYTVYRHASAR